jgi:hypothetical protein
MLNQPVTRLAKIVLLLPLGCALLANSYVTDSKKLFETADLVVEATVIENRIVHTYPNGWVERNCARVQVGKRLKGSALDQILVCRSTGIAEMSPRPPDIGRSYLMYLQKDPDGIYSTFSVACLQPIQLQIAK